MKINNLVCLLVGAALLFAPTQSFAATIAAYSSFGGGDGWLAPGEGGYTFLGTANNERGIAFGNGKLYLVSRNGGNFVRRLDASTGADLGSPLDTTGITGGTFAVNAIGVGGDGAIYVGNLTTNSTTSAYKVYKWASEATTPPVVAYSGNGGLAGSRLGDNMAAIGSDSATLLAAGYGSTPAVAGNNSYAIVDPTAGAATAIAFPTPPNAGDFRLGITFVDSSRVIGTQGSSLYRYTSFAGSTGTLIGSPAIPDPAGATADRLLSYTSIAGVPILAIQSIGDSHVSIYDVSDPAAPVYIASKNNTSGTLTANANGSGALAWGETTVNGDGTISRILYAMSTNQGIQAFVVTVPEPGTATLVAMVMGLVAFRRRRAV